MYRVPEVVILIIYYYINAFYITMTPSTVTKMNFIPCTMYF